MKRRHFLASLAFSCLPVRLQAEESNKFQFTVLRWGNTWNERPRAMISLAFEMRKRCNIPINTQPKEVSMDDLLRIDSPFMVLSGSARLPDITLEQAATLRRLLQAGGTLLIDDHSAEGDPGFYESALETMRIVYSDVPKPYLIPKDHSVFQSFYLLKEARGRLDRSRFFEGWPNSHDTRVFFSHNDLLGALDVDESGHWTHTMAAGGGARRELCFRLAINLVYHTLTLNYKKDRAFPPVIERRRRA